MEATNNGNLWLLWFVLGGCRLFLTFVAIFNISAVLIWNWLASSRYICTAGWLEGLFCWRWVFLSPFIAHSLHGIRLVRWWWFDPWAWTSHALNDLLIFLRAYRALLVLALLLLHVYDRRVTHRLRWSLMLIVLYKVCLIVFNSNYLVTSLIKLLILMARRRPHHIQSFFWLVWTWYLLFTHLLLMRQYYIWLVFFVSRVCVTPHIHWRISLVSRS